jgi:hypothetical protein
MTYSKHSLLLCIILLAILMPMSAQARDVGREQYQVTAAQKDYNAAKADYDSASQQVRAHEEKLAQEKAQLAQKVKLQTAAKVSLDKSKALLDQQLQALDRAWNKDR